jgi:UDP-N-acetyl-D-mannosaminuronate dehydrogenase
MDFVDSNKGSRLVRYLGYLYVKERVNVNTGDVTWRCQQYNKMIGGVKQKCTGRIKQTLNQVHVTQDHNHPPDVAAIEAKVAMNR